MTVPGFTAEVSLPLSRRVSSLARLDRQDLRVQPATAGLPGKVSICDLLPYFPALEPLCCLSIRDAKVSCMCQCKYSTGMFAPPGNICVGPPDAQCDKNCMCRCYGLSKGCTTTGKGDYLSGSTGFGPRTEAKILPQLTRG
jgi:hypothetical protein